MEGLLERALGEELPVGRLIVGVDGFEDGRMTDEPTGGRVILGADDLDGSRIDAAAPDDRLKDGSDGLDAERLKEELPDDRLKAGDDDLDEDRLETEPWDGIANDGLDDRDDERLIEGVEEREGDRLIFRLPPPLLLLRLMPRLPLPRFPPARSRAESSRPGPHKNNTSAEYKKSFFMITILELARRDNHFY